MTTPGDSAFDILITQLDGTQHRLLFETNKVTIGRQSDNDLVLPAGNVSSYHCQIARQAGRFILADVGSTNGTHVNGLRISQPTVVAAHDRISVGGYVLELETAEQSTRPQIAANER